MGRIFLTPEFGKYVREQRIQTEALVRAIRAADRGAVHADLAGCLIKLRIARQGEGKSGGYRTIVAFKAEQRAFFLFGFSKNERANISREEEQALNRYGQLLLGLAESALNELVRDGKLSELKE